MTRDGCLFANYYSLIPEKMNEEQLKPEEMAEKLGIEPEKIDFTINEDEMRNISGAGPVCGEIGYGSPDCTKTGI